jgi:caffeoyl-CoA O-methyltransferase
MSMTPERWQHTVEYIRALFAQEDIHLQSLLTRAKAAGLPEIDVGPETGAFLRVLVRLTRARLCIEVGTLAGYSAIWIARGLPPGGRLICIEASATHVEIARREIQAAGVADSVEVRQGKGGELLPKLLGELGDGAADFILLDAERSEYVELLPTLRALLSPSGVVVVDNALHAQKYVADPLDPGEPPDTMDTVNRAFASAPGFQCTLLPVGNGLLIAVRS